MSKEKYDVNCECCGRHSSTTNEGKIERFRCQKCRAPEEYQKGFQSLGEIRMREMMGTEIKGNKR